MLTALPGAAAAQETLTFALVDASGPASPAAALPPAIEGAMDETTTRLATRLLLEPDRVFEREVLGRSGGLVGARAAFFDGEYDDAAELLGGWLRTFTDDPWVLALHEDVAVRAVDALLTLVRAEHELGHDDVAASALQQTVELFPTAALAETQYPEWLRVRFELGRDALDGTATLQAPPACSATLNGLPAPDPTVPIGRDGGWARWDCGGRRSRLYRVDPGSVLTYPEALDTALRLSEGVPQLAVVTGDPAAIGETLGQAAALLGASSAEGWAAWGDQGFLLVHAEVLDASIVITAARGSGGVAALRACARGGDCGRGLERWTLAAGWPQRLSVARTVGVAALTTAGISAAAGTALELMVSGSLSRVDRCAESPACLADPGAMDERRDRARTARAGATAAWISAGVTLTAGLIALVPDWHRAEPAIGVSADRHGALLTLRIGLGP